VTVQDFPICRYCGSSMGQLLQRQGSWFHRSCEPGHREPSIPEPSAVPVSPTVPHEPATQAGPVPNPAAVPGIPQASPALGGAVADTAVTVAAGEEGVFPGMDGRPALGDIDWAGRPRGLTYEQFLALGPAEPATTLPPVDAAPQALPLSPTPSVGDPDTDVPGGGVGDLGRRCDWCGAMGATVPYPGDEWYHLECAGEEFLAPRPPGPNGEPGATSDPTPGGGPGGFEAWDEALAGAELEDLHARLRCVLAVADVLEAMAEHRLLGKLLRRLAGGGE